MRFSAKAKKLLICMTALCACLAMAACGSKEPTERKIDLQSWQPSEEEEAAEMIPVLAYHKIKPYDPADEATILEMYDTTFEEEMNYLRDNDFVTLTTDEFYQWYRGEIEVPKKSVLVTFDDGFYGLHYYAYPVIKRNGQAATAFLIGHLIEDKTPEWDPNAETDYRIGLDVIESTREEYPRFSYESHTFNMHKKIKSRHPVNVFTREEMVQDCESNARFGFTYLAYPWGDYNEEFQGVLKEMGYRMAFGYDDPFYYATRNDDQYAINRVRINGTCSLDDFIEIVNCESEKHIPPEMSGQTEETEETEQEN